MRPSHYGKWGQRGKFVEERVPKGHCRWCGDPIPKGSGRRSYCSVACRKETWLRIVWNAMRRFIMDRDKVCVLCGGASYKPNHNDKWMHSAPSQWTPCGFDGPGVRVDPEWHVDHIKPVSEGGTDDPNNLRLLCGECHKRITREWHGERAAQRRAAKPHTMEMVL